MKGNEKDRNLACMLAQMEVITATRLGKDIEYAKDIEHQCVCKLKEFWINQRK